MEYEDIIEDVNSIIKKLRFGTRAAHLRNKTNLNAKNAKKRN